MNNPDELKLIQDFNNGNEQAYNQLVLRYKEKIYWIVRRMIPNHDDADDITQNVFIKAYQSLRSFKGDSSFYTWIYRIAINLSLNEIRRKKVCKTFSIDEEIHQISTSDDQPIQILINEERTRLIKKAIERVPEKHKKVFLLRYYDELP